VVRTIAQSITAMAATALLLGLLSGNSSARSLSAREQQFGITWGALEFGSSTSTIRCRATLEGSFHTRAIAKVRGSLVGAITRAIIAHPGCTNGEAWMDNGTEAEPLGRARNRLPFHVTYESFGGTLPEIAEVNLSLSRVSFVLQGSFLGIACLARYGRAEDNIIAHAFHEPAHSISTVFLDPTVNRFSRVDQLLGSVCAATGSLAGSSNRPTTPTGEFLRISLI